MPAPGTHPGPPRRVDAPNGTPARRDAARPGRGEETGRRARPLRSFRRFLRETRAAVGLAAAAISIMVLGGAALIGDHLWMVGKRDLLQRAADAAATAATFELRRRPGSESDAQVEAALRPLAERYARFNVLGNTTEDLEPEDIEVTLAVDRAAGTVGVSVKADIVDTLFAKMLYGYEGPGKVTTRAGAERDTTMDRGGARARRDQLDGEWALGEADPPPRVSESRMEIVRRCRPRAGRHPRPGGRGVHDRDRGRALAYQRASRTRRCAPTWERKRWAEYPVVEDLSAALTVAHNHERAGRPRPGRWGRSRRSGKDVSINAR